MKDETMAGYYQLLIAIFCNLNAREARYLYDYTGSPSLQKNDV